MGEDTEVVRAFWALLIRPRVQACVGALAVERAMAVPAAAAAAFERVLVVELERLVTVGLLRGLEVAELAERTGWDREALEQIVGERLADPAVRAVLAAAPEGVCGALAGL